MKKSSMMIGVATAALLGSAGVAVAGKIRTVPSVDTLVSRGLVYTGDLAVPKVTDIGITGDRIVFIGDAAKAGVQAKRVVDAKGLMVTPGFIDAHTHSVDELTSADPGQRLVLRQVSQGITTSIIGVDGEGTPDVTAQIAQANAVGVGQNFATYVGFGAIRTKVLGEDARAPNSAELQAEKALAAKGMCEGALGLSSGLFYAPQSFAKIEEVIEVAKEAGKRGGLYDTHQRDEGTSTIGVVASLREAIRIGEESGAPLHVAHIKITGGSKPDGQSMVELIAMIDAARAKGQKVTADQYPWSAANTGLVSVVIPRWAQDGGRAAMLKRFANPIDVARIKAESGIAHGDADHVVIDHAAAQPEILGKSLAELGAAWGIDPTDAAIRILQKSEDARVAVFVMTEPDIKKAMTQPWVMTSSDGRNGDHPRGFASFARLWANYVIDRKVLTPVEFVHRSSGLTADTLGLKGRGYIRLGYYADIAVIDPKRYLPKATYVEPTRLSTGVVDVMVNGKLELADGTPTGVLSGRGIIKTPRPGTCP